MKRNENKNNKLNKTNNQQIVISQIYTSDIQVYLITK